MSAFIPIPISEIETQQEQPSATYRLDLGKGRICGRINGLAAVEQAIRKALLTPRFKCLVYDNQYGSEIKQTVVAGDATREYIETEMPRLVNDALLTDSRILDIYGFSFTLENEKAFISFTAKTVFGDTVIEEAI